MREGIEKAPPNRELCRDLVRGTPGTPEETQRLPLFLLLLVGVPLLELYLLIQVGSEIGALPTIALSVLTAILGTWLVRMQGFAVLLRVRVMLERGETPALEVLDGAVLLIAGLMLLLPGFLTDALGFLLLIPPLRRLLIRRFVRVLPAREGPQPDRRPRVIEGEFRRERDL
jgi:UPF0716 protein FxsA